MNNRYYKNGLICTQEVMFNEWKKKQKIKYNEKTGLFCGVNTY